MALLEQTEWKFGSKTLSLFLTTAETPLSWKRCLCRCCSPLQQIPSRCVSQCARHWAIFGSISQSSPLKAEVLPGHSAFREHLFFTAIFSSQHGWTPVERNRFCRQGYIKKKKEALSITQATVTCIARVFNFMLLHSHSQYNLQRCFITNYFLPLHPVEVAN